MSIVRANGANLIIAIIIIFGQNDYLVRFPIIVRKLKPEKNIMVLI